MDLVLFVWVESVVLSEARGIRVIVNRVPSDSENEGCLWLRFER